MKLITYKVRERERLQAEAIKLGVSIPQMIEKAILSKKWPELKVDVQGRWYVYR